MALTGLWTLGLSEQIEVLPTEDQRAYLPIPPFSFPVEIGDFSLTSPFVAISVQSIAARANWQVGAYCKATSQLPTLPPLAVSQSLVIPINRGARILEIPEWARVGYQLQFEIPAWIEQLQIEVYLYDPS